MPKVTKRHRSGAYTIRNPGRDADAVTVRRVHRRWVAKPEWRETPKGGHTLYALKAEAMAAAVEMLDDRLLASSLF